MSTAEGASVRMRAREVEIAAEPQLLFDHLAELLQEMLAKHPNPNL